MAYFPHDTDTGRTQVHAWTVHSLTHHSLPIMAYLPHDTGQCPLLVLSVGGPQMAWECVSMCVCVCVCVRVWMCVCMHVCMEWSWSMQHMLKPSEDSKPTGLKVDTVSHWQGGTPSSWTIHCLTHHGLPPMWHWHRGCQVHELSTLWPITAFLPHNADVRRCKVYSWTVHTLTHHSLPPTYLQHWWQGTRQGRELSTLLLITAYLPHNDRRRCQVHAWTVHTLTHHGQPPMWRWQGMMPSSWTVNTFTHHSLPPTQRWQ